MNSRKRVQAAISFKEADRVPIDNNGNVSGMHEVAYNNLLKFLGLNDEIRIYDPVQRLAEVSDEIKDMLGVDTRYIYPNAPSNYQFKENADGTFKDEFGTVYRRVGYYADAHSSPLRDKTFEEIKSFKFPDPADPSRFEGIRERAVSLNENTEYSIWAGPVNSLFYLSWCLRGLDQFMVDLYGDPDIAEYLMDAIVDWNLGFFEKFYGEIGDLIDVFWIGDDWGIQNGPLVSPEYFRREVVPRFKKMISYIKTKTEAKCCYHSCGATYWCIGDMIEMGVDIIHPLQANADGNDTEKIKEEFGKKIMFHGGTNNQGVFHKNIHILTIDTLKRIKDLAPGGGYIFSSGHNIQANMPPENIVRLFELAREHGKYPIDIDRIEKRIEEEEKLLKDYKKNK
ncbi:uroporphyrinogen decarboxylase family protein [Actinomycetota bacterium]